MLNVSNNIKDVLSWTDRLSSQYAFAVALALTDTARTVAKAMPDKVAASLDKPTRFTRGAFYFKGANKRELTAWVGVKDKQAQYLQYQIYGGDRFPNRKALKLPGEIQLDEFGNIRRNDLRRLIAEAKRVGKASAKGRRGKTSYSGKSQGVFYGKPANRPELPVGIYRRVGGIDNGQQRRLLQPLVLFPAKSARYHPRFDFHGIARREALAAFEPALAKAWARAKATAR